MKNKTSKFIFKQYLFFILTVIFLTAIISIFTHFYLQSHSLFVLFFVVIVIFAFSYFAPQLNQIIFNVKIYEGKYRQDLLKMLQKYQVDIKYLAIKKDSFINAQAIGILNNKMILFNSGLLEECSWEEIEAVFAHEVGHHRNNDILIYTISGAAALLAAVMIDSAIIQHSHLPLIIVSFLTSILIFFIAMALSQVRERGADGYAKKILSNGKGLTTFLERFDYIPQKPDLLLKSIAMHPWIYDRIEYFKE